MSDLHIHDYEIVYGSATICKGCGKSYAAITTPTATAIATKYGPTRLDAILAELDRLKRRVDLLEAKLERAGDQPERTT